MSARMEWTDAMILQALDMHERQGPAADLVGQRFGVSRSAVLGLIKRIRDADVPCGCVRPENRDGGMPARWWDVPAQHRRRA